MDRPASHIGRALRRQAGRKYRLFRRRYPKNEPRPSARLPTRILCCRFDRRDAGRKGAGQLPRFAVVIPAVSRNALTLPRRRRPPVQLLCHAANRLIVEPKPKVARPTSIRNPRCAGRVGSLRAGTGANSNDGIQSQRRPPVAAGGDCRVGDRRAGVRTPATSPTGAAPASPPTSTPSFSAGSARTCRSRRRCPDHLLGVRRPLRRTGRLAAE